MKRNLIIITLLLILFTSQAVFSNEIYMAIDKGEVLFMIDRNHWEMAPNYLKLKIGDYLRVMPGTTGKIFFANGAEFHLPSSGTVNIEENGISQIIDNEKIIIKYHKGLYESEVVPFNGNKIPDYDFPRLIETYPSSEQLLHEKDVADETGNYIRSRLDSALRSVITEDLSKPRTRFSPTVPDPGLLKDANNTSLKFNQNLRENVTSLQLYKIAEEKLRTRRNMETSFQKISDLNKIIAVKKGTGSLALDEIKMVKDLSVSVRSKRIRLENLQNRERELKKK